MSAAFLVALGWKSSLILGVLLMLLALMRSRPAAEKSAVARWSILALLALPVMLLLAPPVPIEATWLAVEPSFSGGVVPGDGRLASADLASLLACVYVAGVVSVLIRVSLGMVMLRRWIGRATPITELRWRAPIAETVGSRARVLACDALKGPLSSGWLRPVILIDHATLQRPEHARAVLAHEAAHIAHGDWIALLGMHVAAALFWFNPLVWIAKHVAEQCAEEAADQHALVGNDAITYAQALLDCAGAPSVSVAVGMSQSRDIRRRMRLILAHTEASAPSTWRTASVLASVLAFSALVGLVTFVAPARASISLRPMNASSASAVGSELAPAVLDAPDASAQEPILVAAPQPVEPLDTDAPPSLEEVQTTSALHLDEPQGSAPSEAQRQRWEANMRRHESRDERRRRRDQARENRAWLQTQAAENPS